MLTILNSDKPQHKLQLIERESELTMYNAIEGEQISVMANQDKRSMVKAINLLIFQLQDGLNITNKLNEFQVLEITTLLMKQYWYLRLEEIMLVFRNAKMGKYGQFYNRLDMSMIFSWFENFVSSEERAMMFERKEQESRAKEIDTKKFESAKSVQEAYLKLRQESTVKRTERKGNTPVNVPPLFPDSEDYLNKLEKALEECSDEELKEFLMNAQKSNFKAAVELAKKEMVKRKEQETDSQN